MIQLKKQDTVDVNTALSAITNYFVELAELKLNDYQTIKLSIAKDLVNTFQEAKNKAYKKDSFNFKLLWHQAKILSDALLDFIKIIQDDFIQNRARKMQMTLDQKLK